MISLSTARQLILENTPPLPPTTLPLHHALGLILHSPATADSDLPAHSRSAMDGYALPLNDPSTHFTVIGEIQPGEKSSLNLHHGETARIFTGALIPHGAGRVIPQENVQLHDSSMTILTPTSQTFIRHQGEEARQGDLLLHPGSLLGPAEISLLAQIGITHPSVFPRPRVFHCVTGNELVDPSTTPAPGQIRDSNSPLIAALLHSHGAQLVAHSRSPDDLNTLLSTIKNTPEDWDALLISGGASVGDYDFGAKALLALGFTIHFRQISLRPGKPLIFATRGPQIAFVIPGNPVSHFVTFHLAIRLALDLLKSTPPSWPLLHAQLLAPIPTPPNPRETFWPASLQIIDHQLHATPLHWQSSGDLLGLLNAHALIPIPPNSPPPPPSTLTPVLLLAFP